MGRSRKSIEELGLSGGNINRALSYGAEKEIAHREELEQQFADLRERRAAALADIRTRGLIIIEERFQRGQLYQHRIANPAVRIASECERQMAALAKLLSAPSVPKEKTGAEYIATANAMLKRLEKN